MSHIPRPDPIGDPVETLAELLVDALDGIEHPIARQALINFSNRIGCALEVVLLASTLAASAWPREVAAEERPRLELAHLKQYLGRFLADPDDITARRIGGAR